MASRQKVTITDIAKAAGVSISAVSRVLNNKSGDIKISEATQQRIIDVAERLGYQANPFASALRTNRTGIIGALNPNFSGTYMSLLTKHLVTAARKRNVELLVGAPERSENQIAGQINKLQNLLFDGLLLLTDMLGYQTVIRNLKTLKKPYVAVSAGMNIAPPYVNIDEIEVMRLSIDYLYTLGHRRIAFLTGAKWATSFEKIELFKSTMQSFGLTIYPSHLAVMENLLYTPLENEFHTQSRLTPLAYAQNLMQLDTPPTAIVCSNDGFAIAAIKGCLKMGLRVPDDVSIIGAGNELTSDLFYPELTTIQTPFDQLADASIDLLLKLIENPKDKSLLERRVIIQPMLLERESCRRIEA